MESQCTKNIKKIRKTKAQFLLDLIEMRDNFRHSGSFLSFNEVYDIIVHLATQ